MRSLVITVPAAQMEQVNTELESRGYGPNNVSVPMKDGEMISSLEEVDENGDPVVIEPTHYSCHWWASDAEYNDIMSIADTILADCTINSSEDLSDPLGVFGATNGDYVRIVHKEFSEGQWGWRAEFITQSNEFEAGVRSISIFNDALHTQFLYTTGAFIFDNGVWVTEWNTGAGAPADIHWALRWASAFEYKSTLLASDVQDIGWLRQGIPGGAPVDPTIPPMEWVAGGGTGVAGSYNQTDRVTYPRPADGGEIWIFSSNIDANTSEPGQDGELDRWWAPVERLDGTTPGDPGDPGEPELPPQWVQGGGTGQAGTYVMDVLVVHDRPQHAGNIWVFKSKLPANDTEPSRDSTFDRWWEPIARVEDWMPE